MKRGFDVSADYRPEQLIETVCRHSARLRTGDRRETERHKLSATDFYHRKDRQDAVSRLCEKVSDRLPRTETDILRRRPGESKTGGRDPHQQRASDIQKDKDYINPSETTTGYVEKRVALSPHRLSARRH